MKKSKAFLTVFFGIFAFSIAMYAQTNNREEQLPDLKVQHLIKNSPETAEFFLLEAIFKSDLATIDHLLENGLNPNCIFKKFPNGKTDREKHSMVGFMIGGVTPLMAATIYEDKAIIKHLINRGANPNFASEKNDQTHHLWLPLTLACLINSPDCVETLIENGADVKIKDSLGRSLAFYAFVDGANYSGETSRDMLEQVLAKHGITKMDRDNKGESVLDWLKKLKLAKEASLKFNNGDSKSNCKKILQILTGAMEFYSMDNPDGAKSIKKIGFADDDPLVKNGYLKHGIITPEGCSYIQVNGDWKDIRCSKHGKLN